MHCVKTPTIFEDTIKKSRFIGLLVPCQTESEAIQTLGKIQHQHPNANHIAFAYRIKSVNGIKTRFHDAGEPNGTAGKPIFQYLEGNNLINTLCIVVRYFGGIKLGAGGLTRAYGNTAKQVINACTLTKYIEYLDVILEIDYKQKQHFEYHLEKLSGQIINQGYAEKIHLLVRIPKHNMTSLNNIIDSATRNHL